MTDLSSTPQSPDGTAAGSTTEPAPAPHYSSGPPPGAFPMPPATTANGSAGSSSSWKAWVAAGAAAAVVAVGAGIVIGRSGDDGATANVAAAAGTYGNPNGTQTGQFQGGPGGFRGGGVAGEITKIDGSTITVKASDGTTSTVEITDDTTVTETAEGGLDGIEVGDHVTAIDDSESASSTSDPTATPTSIDATQVVDNNDLELGVGGPDGRGPGGGGPPAGMPPGGVVTNSDGSSEQGMPQGSPEGAPQGTPQGTPDGQVRMFRPIAGEVTAVDGATITIETASGDPVEVRTDGDTEFSETVSIDAGDLKVGDTIRAIGTTTDGTTTATSIRKGDLDDGPGFGPGGPGGGRMPPSGAPQEGSTTQTTI
jgi:hypothetical protein